uniref:Uncharacterized protein n=1 Tax=Candidatus Kentrum sp. TC TaxID=2126339 RepID=A0A450YQT2_9GAMM|nr:MAG: hypothetical protein BECKTC1821E_GA0114239_102926 [Candidatus Kentron sp. TC]
MDRPLAVPCQQGKQNPRGLTCDFQDIAKRGKNLYTRLRFSAVSVVGISEYAKVEPLLIGIQPRGATAHYSLVRILTEPHQSPLWIKAAGVCPSWSKTPGPWLYEPQKILSTLPSPSGSRAFIGNLLSICKRECIAVSRIHGLPPSGRYPTHCWLDDGGVSVEPFAFRHNWGGVRWLPIKFHGLCTN